MSSVFSVTLLHESTQSKYRHYVTQTPWPWDSDSQARTAGPETVIIQVKIEGQQMDQTSAAAVQRSRSFCIERNTRHEMAAGLQSVQAVPILIKYKQQKKTMLTLVTELPKR